MMFDSRHVLDPLLDSDQAVTLVKVHLIPFQRYVRTGIVAGLRVVKMWHFLSSDLVHCSHLAVNSEQLSVPSHHL